MLEVKVLPALICTLPPDKHSLCRGLFLRKNVPPFSKRLVGHRVGDRRVVPLGQLNGLASHRSTYFPCEVEEIIQPFSDRVEAVIDRYSVDVGHAIVRQLHGLTLFDAEVARGPSRLSEIRRNVSPTNR